jgi:hypothetical protein
MRIIAVVFGEWHIILFAFTFHHSEKVERWFTQIGADKKRRYLNVEWRKGVPETSVTKLHTVSSRASRGPRRIGYDPLG